MGNQTFFDWSTPQIAILSNSKAVYQKTNIIEVTDIHSNRPLFRKPTKNK